MTLDTTIGRWMSEDPEGFRAADANLYRYVGNDPTNEVDPTGLEGYKVETHRTPDPDLKGQEVESKGDMVVNKGKEVGAKYLPGSINFPVATPDGSMSGLGTVKVYLNSSLTRKLTLKGGKNFDYTLENLIQLDFSATIPTDGFHWIQFVTLKPVHQSAALNAKGGVRKLASRAGFGNAKFGRVGDQYLDGSQHDRSQPPDPNDAYYDTHGVHVRGQNDLSIFDQPGYDANEELVEDRAVFDDYLVAGGKVYYHVQWEFQAFSGPSETDKTKTEWLLYYAEVRGEPASKLPAYASGKWLPGPYNDLDAKNEDARDKIPNPLAP